MLNPKSKPSAKFIRTRKLAAARIVTFSGVDGVKLGGPRLVAAQKRYLSPDKVSMGRYTIEVETLPVGLVKYEDAAGSERYSEVELAADVIF